MPTGATVRSGAKLLEQRVREYLADLETRGLLRALAPPSGIDFSSNDYLNLSTHPIVAERLIEAVTREGCGSTGSRLLRGERACFESVEQCFARFKGTERALLFSSGYLANVAVLTALPEASDVIFSDERNHASLIDGTRLSRARTTIFPHNDVASLADMLTRNEHRSGISFIVVESLFSMDGDEAPLSAYADLCRARGAVLIVDEAHAVGVYGARGSGLIEASGIAQDVCVSTNAAGKALGVAGAFVAGPSWAIEYLIQRARPFVFSTAPPPAVAAALEGSLAVIEGEPWRRENLRARASYLNAALAAAGIPVRAGSSHIIPIVLGDNERAVAVSRLVRDRGFDVRAIRPPSVPAGTARLRVSVNAGLSEASLDRFVSTLVAALRETGQCSKASS
jgi:8-amino-7-oxononanoate synthase